MATKLLYPVGNTNSCRFAARFLERSGFCLTDHPSPDITHLLLDIPSFHSGGAVTNGSDLKGLLRMLPENITIIGGNLVTDILTDYRKIDLLQDPLFLAKNAAITAECALRAAAPYINTTFADTPALILGWGRIGKCLAKLLSAMGCPVAVTVRKKTDSAMLEALGYEAVEFSQLSRVIMKYRILFNTVPALQLPNDITQQWNSLIKIDLASYPGLEHKDTIIARGLPGKYAPESTAKLICETILRICKEEIS